MFVYLFNDTDSD